MQHFSEYAVDSDMMEKSFKNLGLLALWMLGFALTSWSNTIEIKGTVVDDENQEPIIGVNITTPNLQGAISNEEGVFSIVVPIGNVTLFFSHVGYFKDSITFYAENDTVLQVKMVSGFQTDEVVVSAKRISGVVGMSDNGNMILSAKALQKIPTMLGERELLKGIQMLPGVQSGNEGARGIFVRGGGPDQNLVLFEGAPVYNVAHLYGIFSVFNSDIVNQAELYKNHIPARFGGRLASVLEVNTGEPNAQKWKGSASIGLFTSKVFAGGPIIKEKLSIQMALRGCYAGLFSGPLSAKQFESASESGRLTYNFYDANISVFAKPTQKSRLEAHFFKTDDKYQLENDWRSQRIFDLGNIKNVQYKDDGDYQLRWKNLSSSVQWIFDIKDNIQLSHYLTYSQYELASDDKSYSRLENIDTAVSGFTTNTINIAGVRDFGLKGDISWRKDIHQLRAGYAFTRRAFNTGKGIFSETSQGLPEEITNYGIGYIPVYEADVFAEYSIQYQWLNLQAGVRPVYYNDGRTYHQWTFQPRFMGEAYLPKNLIVQTSVVRSVQNVHLLTSSAGSILNDFWVPATSLIPSASSWQYGSGIRQKFDKGYEWSVDLFYRDMSGMIEYKEGAAFVLFGDSWEQQIAANGKGRAYGVEFFAAKSKGKFTAWAKYTFSKTERKFDDLNRGNWFPAKYDRTHDASFIVNYKFNDRIDLTLSWVYGTGNTFTLSNAQYPVLYVKDYFDQYNGDEINLGGSENVQYYESRNNIRLKSYHHLDIGMNYRRESEKLGHLFNASIYNIYNRLNVFNVYVDYTEDANGTPSLAYKTLSLFPLLPSVSYTITIK